MKNLSNVIGSRAARFVSLRVALVLCAVVALAGLGAASAWQHGFEGLSTRKASAQSQAASAPDLAGQAQEPGLKIGNSYSNDTSLRLRDAEQVPIKSNELEFGQSTKAHETVTARDTNRGALLVAGIFPGTDGEVGATQRVKIANRSYQIFDNRAGASVLGPSDISTIWAGFGGSCETGGAGDAVVLYDKDADRWVFSRFASATSGQAATEECFAVSTTSDATGSYYRYAFHLGGTCIDSPHLTAQSDGYLMGDSIYNESGTERLGTQSFLFDRTAMLAGSAAAFTSPGLDAGVGETYSISADGVRLVSGPSSLAVTTLTINLTYASDATFTGAGLSAADIVNMKAANTYAASQFTNNFRDAFNVNISVTAVPGTGTLGGSNTSIFTQSFTTGIRDPTRADATSTDDATMAGAGGSVPAGLADPISGTHNWWVTKAQRKALKIVADDSTTDGTYTFGGGFAYTYDPNNRAVAGKYDYIGVSMHEFSEIMGRIGGLGASISGSPAYLQMDLFHYTGANTRGLTNGAGRSFSFNNGTALLKAFNNGALHGGDAQDWATGTNDTFNAFSDSGVRNDLTAVDLQVMDVIGYDKASNPPPVPTATAATNVTGSSFTANWSSSSGATGYRLDVSTSSSFGSFVSGYQNLDVGNVLTRSVTGLSAATTYFYRVRAYNGGGTSGDSNIISVTTSGGGLPDLLVTALTAPSTGAIGGQITVATTVVNQGAANAGAFRVGFYLSTDNIITTGDTFTGWGCSYPSGLAAGASTSCDGPVGIPSSLPPGTYFFGAIADDLAAVAESNEANNSRAADTGPIVLTSQGQGTCASPYNIVRGQPFNGNTSGGQSVFGSYSCVGWSESGPERVHTITLASSGTLTASLSNLGGNDLDVFILSSCSSGSCLAFGDNAASANVGPGTYYILVDGFQGAIGGYTLTVGNTAFDFDGDGKSDVSVFRPPTGIWYIINSSTGGTRVQGWGLSTDVVVPGDYDGDGKTDLAVWRPSDGVWYIVNSSTGGNRIQGWGVSTDTPVAGDYDGDGKTDLAIWRPSEGTWYIVNSSTGTTRIQNWGVPGDKPLPVDYDGDGKTDLVVWRPSTGQWFINKSSGGTQTVVWGVAGDVPAPADYDGDGKADIAVWRPSTGTWFIINSSNGAQVVVGWGVSGDKPVPTDYDGDGKADVAVWRPGSGTWFIRNSSNGAQVVVGWGVSTDVPIPGRP